MSKKPLKHGELKRRQSAATRMMNSWGSGRAAPSLSIKPARHLIVSEGSKTEPYYFTSISDRVNSIFHGQYVSVDVTGTGMNTISLFDRACLLAKESAAGYTHVWVVYDRDDFPTNSFNRIVEMCEKERTGGAKFHAIWTNEAFELWYILHFEYLQAALPRKDYEPKLSKYLAQHHFEKYQKNRKDMFAILEPMLSDAIANAKKLEQRNEGRTPAESAPGTQVHILMQELLPYIKMKN